MKSADYVAQTVNQKGVSSAVRWMWLGDYVEQIARWAMGDPDQAVLFLLECLDMDDKIQVSEVTADALCVVTVSDRWRRRWRDRQSSE